jgi:predicted dienelactone hydrolase
MTHMLLRTALAGVLGLAATCAQAAGLQLLDMPAASGRPPLKGAVWSPCAAPAREVRLGLLSVPAVKDCPVAGEKLPLVVISHGLGGWFGGHHDTAEALADAGFVVAAIDHPADSGRSETRHPDDLSVLMERPADIKRLIDYMLGEWPDHAKLDPDRIGFFGFSRGGYTGLVLIGGNPDLAKAIALCPEFPKAHWCEQIQKHELPEGMPAHDARIKAAVLADPAFGILFGPESLRDVSIPVELWGSAYGGDGVAPESVSALERILPERPDYRVVANAGHFAFLTPCSPELAKAAPEICADAQGFDRAAFHRQLNAEVVAFFQKHLGAGRQP